MPTNTLLPSGRELGKHRVRRGCERFLCSPDSTLSECFTDGPLLLRLTDFTHTGHELNTMRSAEFQLFSPDSAPADAERSADTMLRQQVTERLAAHRSRRDRAAFPTPAVPERSQASGRTNRI